MNALSLYELNHLVRQTVDTMLAHDYWVEAELSEVRESRGHCYMELVQKDPRSATPIARASAKCWQSQWSMVRPHFERTTGQQLHAGMKVLLQVHAQFHEAYGFSWIVSDIDPTFTLGDMARRRQEIIGQLKQEGVFDMQKELRLPLFCQNIAVVSSDSAAGYGDFVRQLMDNGHGLHFKAELFPAIMQGEQVEQSIIAALNSIYEQIDKFDCVVIIRGGGATADLSGFDTLALAENVAQFPLPVITGIGHDRDESVLDMVSFLRVKTPTAAAQHLIDHLRAVLGTVEDASRRIAASAMLQLNMHKTRLAALPQRMAAATALRMERERNRGANLLAQAVQHIRHQLLTSAHRLELLGQRAQSLDPQLILNRGYSITLLQGRAVRQANELKPGDKIETRLKKGTIKSVIVK